MYLTGMKRREELQPAWFLGLWLGHLHDDDDMIDIQQNQK